jgi:hypothetical protein
VTVGMYPIVALIRFLPNPSVVRKCCIFHFVNYFVLFYLEFLLFSGKRLQAFFFLRALAEWPISLPLLFYFILFLLIFTDPYLAFMSNFKLRHVVTTAIAIVVLIGCGVLAHKCRIFSIYKQWHCIGYDTYRIFYCPTSTCTYSAIGLESTEQMQQQVVGSPASSAIYTKVKCARRRLDILTRLI